MLSFIIGLFVGTTIGICIMCMFQINRYEDIEENSREEK